MKDKGALYCRRSRWRGRPAWILGNDQIQVTVLTGGGHVAELRFQESTGLATVNPLWEPNWETIDPTRYEAGRDAAMYGTAAVGRYLAGMAGHSLCLDCFGLPSEAEVRQGLTIHGEAAVRRWNVRANATNAREARLRMQVDLPLAGLDLTRELRLRSGESVLYFRETVRNHHRTDHFFQWQQHVTLSSAFLAPGWSRAAVPATRGMTWLDGYGSKSLLVPGREFSWPAAPGRDGSTIDVDQPFIRRGTGYVAAAQIDPGREDAFIAACDRRHHLVFGYSFSRCDFPWVTIWEENRARRDSPWNGKTLARGLEFGSSPFPGLRSESFSLGRLMDTPTLAMIPARGQKTVDYAAFLAPVPEDFGDVRDVVREGRTLCIRGTGREIPLAAAAPSARRHPRADLRGEGAGQ